MADKHPTRPGVYVLSGMHRHDLFTEMVSELKKCNYEVIGSSYFHLILKLHFKNTVKFHYYTGLGKCDKCITFKVLLKEKK